MAVNAHKEYRVKNRDIKKYCMLDEMQLLFSDRKYKGTIRIPFMVYESLHEIMYDNYHFLHQEAKCELRMVYSLYDADSEQKILDKVENIIENANKNINRAIDLAEVTYAKNIEYTVAHMCVTRALIYIEYYLTNHEDKINETINYCHDVFVKDIDLCPTLRKDEIKSVREFLGSDIWNSLEDKDVLRKYNEINTSYITRKIKYDR